MKYGIIIKPQIYQKICKPEHYMKKYQGIGISFEELTDIKTREIKYIQIIYLGKKGTEIYLTTTNKYINSQKEHYNTQEDLQKFVSLKDMMKIK